MLAPTRASQRPSRFHSHSHFTRSPFLSPPNTDCCLSFGTPEGPLTASPSPNLLSFLPHSPIRRHPTSSSARGRARCTFGRVFPSLSLCCSRDPSSLHTSNGELREERFVTEAPYTITSLCNAATAHIFTDNSAMASTPSTASNANPASGLSLSAQPNGAGRPATKSSMKASDGGRKQTASPNDGSQKYALQISSE